ncbi:MAG: carboxypeptidase-like regulatory domain-containing protein, partial [Rectinemataceae bacterium]
MKRITVVAAIAALFLLASCEIGTIVTGQDIAGRVYHAETSDFLEDATVKAYDSSGYLMATDATDYLGRYRLQNLATGYGNRVSFEKAGFMPAEFLDVTIFDNNTVYLDTSLSPVPETLWRIQLT